MSVRELFASAGATEDKQFVEDVFSTYLYTGNGSTQTINNGIDLAGKGGMVWIKTRNASSDSVTNNHYWQDSERLNFDAYISSNTTSAQNAFNRIDVSNNGFSTVVINLHESGINYASWTFRKAPKFYTQALKVHITGTPSTIDLSTLGVVGMVTVKRTAGKSNWSAWHKDLTAGNNLKLNLTDAQSATSAYLSVSGTTLTISGSAPSDTYIVYAWAHDVGTDGIIQCGSYVGNGSANGPEINLGWEPQYIMVKLSSGAESWAIEDAMRGIPTGGYDSTLLANTSGAEYIGYDNITLNPTGFKLSSTNSTHNSNGGTYIYLAIRRPMKVPESSSEVFAIDYGKATDPDFVSNFAVDMGIIRYGRTATTNNILATRLTQGKYLQTNTTSLEIIDSNVTAFDYSNGFGKNIGSDSTSNISWMFKRAKGFFDVVCYTGTGVARTVNHNLGVVPELMIVKSRDYASTWSVNSAYINANQYLKLNGTDAAIETGRWTERPTDTLIKIANNDVDVNTSSALYVTYLFATLPSISKVGSYTGNGTTQTIPCGFSTGSRFVLIKRTDSTGDWYIWDSVRGIVAANDPHLSLNTTAAEVTTDDSVDPAVEGFICNQNTATNINVNGGSYIFLAIA